MYEITMWLSVLFARIAAKRQGPVEEAGPQLDPRGLVRNDVLFIKSKLRPMQWAKGTTLEEIAYCQGQADLVKFIETRVIGRRTDA